VPVWADAIRSRPESTTGIAWRWISVGSEKPLASTAFNNLSSRFNSLKSTITSLPSVGWIIRLIDYLNSGRLTDAITKPGLTQFVPQASALSTQTTPLTRLQVIRKQVEGQKRTTPLSEEARLYTVIPNNANQTRVAEFLQSPKRTTGLVTVDDVRRIS
jgi:hypothetical protein